ncbi:MAG TPA: biopolymer transporter ExbD [Leptospiraceae bacterium]|nr:biopolymer transporter ExbD [Leptospiraceae bacterium]HMY66573.1 biopolymer transporter ExbD [Leptospiraceae bacterium]HMZ60978.1 biopolymer transporter ExbD [Leptospiraceae bacterium]HNF13380.1 biopolymer transporter ExbD [Leptospiraceae bacterium]HNF25895.1 biopolymer transporter ExbD [Leptospiraceae bacterium]
MAMSSGGNEDEIIDSINITPMVDVILVLLVIFMVTANFLKKESININLPKVEAADPNVTKSTQVALGRDGKIYLEGTVVNEEKLSSVLTRDAKLKPNMRLTLSADEKIPYGTIMKLMGVIRKTGVTRVALSVKR